MTTNESENEIKSWLEIVLKSEDLKNLVVKIAGNSEKGDGYMGDIVFVEASGVDNEGKKKEYSLVIKCAKRSQVLREKAPVKEAFLNEILFYNEIFPSFTRFQLERNVDDPFDKVPKCYGTLTQGEMEVVVLENLKKKGYIVWDIKKPLTRKHIDMIIDEYGKLHAISIAMKDQEPAKLKEMAEKLYNIVDSFINLTDLMGVFEGNIETIYELLQGELDKNILLKWKNLKNDVGPFFNKINGKIEGMNVIIHGDCWNNNFMHYYVDDQPSTFAILDWQIARFSSPILDLSYFLFSCLSKEDIEDLDVILRRYHTSLTSHLRKLGCNNPNEAYPLNQLLEEWKTYGKYGVIMVTVIHKWAMSEKNEVPDMVDVAESGQDVTDFFTQPLKNLEGFKNRLSYIVKYAAEHDLI